MSRPRRRPLLATNRSPFESLERRQLFCAAHAASFQWTDPNDGDSLARERQRIASLYGLKAPTSYAALSAPAATGDAAGLPVLNSNPGAAVDIYLDFDGDGGTAPGNPHQVVSAYDTNGDANTFDAAEAAVVTQAWQLVANYFAMFDVNVTTDTPTKPFAWTAIGNNVTGGYSYVGVFPQTLAGGPESYTASEFARTRASGIAHEVGHNFGLQHQADFDTLGKLLHEYTSGYDDQHGAIMGVDYAQRVHKWFFGHPSNSVSNLQDDMAVIAARVADISGTDGYRTDDVGDTTATATTLPLAGVEQTRSGILERDGDRDLFTFTSAGGRYLVTANRDVESGADLKLEIFDASNHLIAAEDGAATDDAQLAIDLPAGTYYARLSSHGNYGDTGKYVLTVSPLQNGSAFDSDDVGGVLKRAGGAGYDSSGGIWMLRGGGTDIGGGADQFRYVYQTLHGDGSITARVAGLSGGGTYAKAVLMIREVLSAGARYATAEYRADGTVESLARGVANAATTATFGGAATAGVWLRLTRAGTNLTTERSADGITWANVETVSLPMGVDVYIGMGVTANRDTTTATASFDHVAVTGSVGPIVYPSNGLAAPANVTITPTSSGSGLTATWDAVAGAGSYIVERSTDGLNFVSLGTQSGISYTDATLDGSYRYFYRVTALLGTDASARSAAAVASGINRPSAVTNVTTMSISTRVISLDWRDTAGETGYRIERSLNGFATFSVIATLPANQSSYVNKVLTPSTNYSYRIVPLSEIGEGLASVPVIEATWLAAVTFVHTATAAADALTVSWPDLGKGETGYRVERSLDNTNFATIASVGGDVTSYLDAGLSYFTRYYYRVTATSPYTDGAQSATGGGATQANPSAQTVPIGWNSIDIGQGGGSGATAYNGADHFSVIGPLYEPLSTGDQLRFVYRPFTGDGEVTARLSLLDYGGAQAGVMFRESLAADGRFAATWLGLFGSAARFESRATPGASISYASGGAASVPVWLRLTRVGNLFNSYRSTDGSTWSLIGSATIAMAQTIYVGVAVNPESRGPMALATFTNLGGSAVQQTDVDAPAAPTLNVSDDTGLSATDGTTRDNTLLLSGTAEPAATLTLTRNGSPLTSFTVPATGIWSFAVPTLADGTHLFTATATDASGNASTAATRTVIIDTTPPTVVASSFDKQTGHRWSVQFSEEVGASLNASDFALVNRVTNAVVTPAYTYDAFTRTATLTLPGNALLANGRYELRIAAGAITDVAGNDSATPHAQPFNVLAADFNDSGTVDFDDLLILASHFGQTGKTFALGNASYDSNGTIDFDDLLVLAKTFGSTLPMLATPNPVTTATRKRTSAAFSELTI